MIPALIILAAPFVLTSELCFGIAHGLGYLAWLILPDCDEPITNANSAEHWG